MYSDYYHTQVANYTTLVAYAYTFLQTGYFQLFVPELTTAQANIAIAPLLAKLNSLGIAYTTSTTTYSNFRDAFYGQFDTINTGLFSFGGRLIPESVIANNASALQQRPQNHDRRRRRHHRSRALPDQRRRRQPGQLRAPGVARQYHVLDPGRAVEPERGRDAAELGVPEYDHGGLGPEFEGTDAWGRGVYK